MTSQKFLVIGGTILILLGVLGMVGVLGSTADSSILGSHLWLDTGESWALVVLGIVSVVAAHVLPASGQQALAMILGVLGILIGLYSLLMSNSFLGINLENPVETILYLVLGLWALLASKKSPDTLMQE